MPRSGELAGERHWFERTRQCGGQLFFGTKAEALGRDVRRGMIEPDHPDLSIGQQCKLLSIARSCFYYTPKGETEQNLGLMRRIDEQFLETPFFGVRQMTWHLRNDGHLVNEKRIRRLMRLMGLMPIYRKPNTSRPAKGHKTYPYLLRGLRVERPNQVWCSDITYLPMRRGFLYLVAIMDWHTRTVLSWRISNTLEADFCVEALNEAIHKFGPPEIMNTDQGSQFTSFAWTDRLRRSGVWISMDGKGRFLDNIFIERLWRTLKYECVYLHAWETGSETKAAIRKWMTFYNHQRPHSALGGQPPALVYRQRNDINQPDQQAQRVASITPDPVQEMGSSLDIALLFCPIYQGKPIDRSLSADTVKRLVKDDGGRAGLDPCEAREFSGYSMGVGAAVDPM